MKKIQVPVSVAMLASSNCSFSVKDLKLFDQALVWLKEHGRKPNRAVEYIRDNAANICALVNGQMLKINMYDKPVDGPSMSKQGFLRVGISLPPYTDIDEMRKQLEDEYAIKFSGNQAELPLDGSGTFTVYFDVSPRRIYLYTKF